MSNISNDNTTLPRTIWIDQKEVTFCHKVLHLDKDSDREPFVDNINEYLSYYSDILDTPTIEISNKDFGQYSEDTKFLLPNHEYDSVSKSKIDLWLTQSIAKIKEKNPRYVALSIFSYYIFMVYLIFFFR